MEQQFDILNLLKDKTALLHYILNTIMSCDKNATNLLEMRQKGWSEKGTLDKVIEVTSIQSRQIKHLALVAFLLVKSRDFDTMVAKLMCDMGRGEEALKAMMEEKYKRKM